MAEYDRCHRAVLSCRAMADGSIRLETALRIHCMQHWYNLSDGAMEDARTKSPPCACFARLSLDSALPDRTTIMNFATCSSSINWLNCSRPSIAMAGRSRRHDDQVLWWMPPSLRHPALPRTKSSNAIRRCIRPRKGNQWHFGMKATLLPMPEA